MSRIYDIELPCGCMLSADGGGALIPCKYDDFEDTVEDQARKLLHDASWKKFEESGDQDRFNQEVERLNH